MNERFTRTRIAPTPSGFLHLGNVFSFSLTASLARKTGAKIFLRIDDLDQQRVQPAYVQDIFDTLTYLDIPWDEGPKNLEAHTNQFSQLKRLPLYEKALNQLRDARQVFACSCSRNIGRSSCTCRNKNLSLDESGNAWRMIDRDFIVKKKDGFPSYHLGCVVDDEHFGVDLIVRGEDLRASSQEQRHLAQVLGYTGFMNATIIHHELLMESPEQKLSKSAGATSIQHLRSTGKSPKEIFGLMSKLLAIQPPVDHWQNLAVAIDFH